LDDRTSPNERETPHHVAKTVAYDLWSIMTREGRVYAAFQAMQSDVG
jgi:hypothetical protein